MGLPVYWGFSRNLGKSNRIVCPRAASGRVARGHGLFHDMYLCTYIKDMRIALHRGLFKKESIDTKLVRLSKVSRATSDSVGPHYFDASKATRHGARRMYIVAGYQNPESDV